MNRMRHLNPIRLITATGAICLASGCASTLPVPVAQAPAPTTAVAAETARKGYTAADVRFMQGMIGHHRQALEMSALVSSRTARSDFALMAERIKLSQESEIAQMQRWLQRRGEALPPEDGHVHAAMGHGELTPGMLTDVELAQLESARGVEFERLFLQLMIKHHEGALQMVKDLYRTPGSGQEAELFMLASDVDADQTAEIRRMRTLLAQLR